MPDPPCPEAGKMFAEYGWHKMEKFTLRPRARPLTTAAVDCSALSFQITLRPRARPLTQPTGATRADFVSYDAKWLGAVVPLPLRP